MLRPGLNGRCRVRFEAAVVSHNNSAELKNVQIRGTSEGSHQWLERTAADVTIRARESPFGVSIPGNIRLQQSGAMLASVASLCPANVKQHTNNYASDSCARNCEVMDSSGDSGESFESSTMSDGDSVNINDSQPLLRSTSRASDIMKKKMCSEGKGAEAYASSGSMLEENEGENEVDIDVDIMPESPTRVSDSETHSIQKERESAATTWTDDKHSSFLDSMEATFVRSLFGQQGLGHLGIHGISAQLDDSEQDCVESRPVDDYGSSHRAELYESMQRGQQQSYYRSHGPSSAPAVFANPWVRHFKPKTGRSEQGYSPLSPLVEVTDAHVKEVSAAVDVSVANLTNTERDRNVLDAVTLDCSFENKEESGDSEAVYKNPQCGAEVLEIEQGLRLWQTRLHKGGQTVANPSNRKDMASRVLKRPSNFEVENAELFVTKRIKSTQHDLAQKDLEMLDQYVAEQRAESFQAATEHSEQVTLDHAWNVIEPSIDPAGPSLVFEHTDSRKMVGKSPKDQVVPLLGRMDSYESKSSSSFPDLNAPFLLSTATACAGIEPGSMGHENRILSSVPDLNSPPAVSIVTTCAANQPTIPFIEDGVAAETSWFPEPGAGKEEAGQSFNFVGASYYPLALSDDKHALDGCGSGGSTWLVGKHGYECEVGAFPPNFQSQGLEVGEAYECEPPLSPKSTTNSKTWTWCLHGSRRRLHDTEGRTPSSRSLRDSIRFGDPLVVRPSGQQV